MNQEIGFRPLPAVPDDTAARDQEMDMGMISNHPGPGLEDSDETDIRTEKPSIPRESHDSPGGRPEEEGIERFLTHPEGLPETFRHGDGGHEIRNRQQESDLLFEPSLSFIVLTLRAVPVTAGMVGVPGFPAVIAMPSLPAEFRRAASDDIPHGPGLTGQDAG